MEKRPEELGGCKLQRTGWDAPGWSMAALPPKADMCSATRDVCFGPEADIVWLADDARAEDFAVTLSGYRY
jgi:hypothetical protein